MNIVLIGYRGTGKTTVARLLSQRLGWPWVDSDEEIERQAGKSIAAVFAEEGEAGFRARERRVIANLAEHGNTILSLGGGAILDEQNQQAILPKAKVVWLTAPPEVLWSRISADSSSAARRPNLTASGGITEIIATLERRTPVYRQCAQWVVDTAAKTPEEVADAILEQITLAP